MTRLDEPRRYVTATGCSRGRGASDADKALLPGASVRLSPRQVGARLRQTADDIGPRLTFGHGMVDADAAIR